MKEEQEQSDTNATILLYLAGELGEPDRVRFEGRLAEDAQLREELNAIRRDMEAGMGLLTELDDRSHPLNEGVAQRRATRMIRQWALLRSVAPPPAEPVIRRPIPWGKAGMAAAAMLVLGFTVWGVYHPSRRSPARMTPVAINTEERVNLLVATMGIADLDDTDDVQTLVPPRLDDVDFSGDLQSRTNLQ
jgi:anti-sigma factor RsiW